MVRGYKKSGTRLKLAIEDRFYGRRFTDLVGAFQSNTFFDRHEGWTSVKQKVYKKSLDVKSLRRVDRYSWRFLPESFYWKWY